MSTWARSWRSSSASAGFGAPRASRLASRAIAIASSGSRRISATSWTCVSTSSWLALVVTTVAGEGAGSSTAVSPK